MKYAKEKERVKSFLDNKLIVRKGFPPLDISKGINWNYVHKNNSGTFQTYLHSLGIIRDLVIMSVVDNNIEYEKMARDYILDWFKFDHKKGKNWAWKEHPVSSRVNNLIYFQDHAKEFKLAKEDFENIIIQHCEYLNDEKFYKFNNHGLMMDKALLNAAKYIQNKDVKQIYVDKALYRVRYAISRDFSRNGVHLENSSEYHRMVIMILNSIVEILKELKTPLGSRETEIINLAKKFRNVLIQPDQVYPSIGDTGHIHDKRIKKVFSNFIDYEAGLSIFNNVNNEIEENSTMLIFKSGYQNMTHKHLDDLSTYLYMDGKELLCDSGKYSYSGKDPIRKHVVSPKGHSTVYIDNQSYELKNPVKEQSNLRITRQLIKPHYKLVTGINRLYSDSNMTRFVVLTKDNICIIVDRVVSQSRKSINQNFNLNEKADISKISELKYEVEIEDQNFVFETVIKGDAKINSKIEKGYISREFGKYSENERLIFNQLTKNATFITLIYNKNNPHEISDVSLLNSVLKYTIDNRTVSVQL